MDYVSIIFTFGGIRMRPIEIVINRIELHQKTYAAGNGEASFKSLDIYDRGFLQGLVMAKLIAQLVDIETKDQ